MTTYIKPTYLYIKQHSITGLKYFGKTTTKDPYKYKGSGVDWIPHLKEYGSEHVITTIIFGPCTDSEAISEFAISFSRDNNIVTSNLWANRKIETGLDGGGVAGSTRSTKTKQKMSDTKKGIPNGRKGIPTGPNGRKGIPTGPSIRKGKPTGKQLNPSSKPSHRKGTPSGKKGIPNGRKGIPTGSNGRKGIPIGPQPTVTCPHCGKIGGVGGMHRYHFDNCKSIL
jgi:hypothetical protein